MMCKTRAIELYDIAEKVPIEELGHCVSWFSSLGDFFLVDPKKDCWNTYVNAETFLKVAEEDERKKYKIDVISGHLLFLKDIARTTWLRHGESAPLDIKHGRGTAAVYKNTFSWLKERNEHITRSFLGLGESIHEAIRLDGFIYGFLEQYNWFGPHIVNHVVEYALGHTGPTSFEGICCKSGEDLLSDEWVNYCDFDLQSDYHSLETKLHNGDLLIYKENPLVPIDQTRAAQFTEQPPKFLTPDIWY